MKRLKSFVELMNDLRLDGSNGWQRTERPDGAVLLQKEMSTGRTISVLLMAPGDQDALRRKLM